MPSLQNLIFYFYEPVGAVAPLYPAMATAEIEADGENGEVVTAESPTAPQTNLEALLQSGASDMDNIPNRAIFLPYFMSVYSEEDEVRWFYLILF